MVLYAAVLTAGSPEVLVSDSGSVFRAKRAKEIYTQLGIRKEYIARRQPWQSYIETAFNIQRRMTSAAFAEATTYEEIVAVHDQWVADYNVQDHWAHRLRRDARSSPAEVLAWVRGTRHDERRLKRIFYTLRFVRRVDRAGYIRFRHWKIYSESGLAGRESVLWLYRETLTVTAQEETVATYTVRTGRVPSQFETVSDPTFYPSQLRPQQQTLGDVPESAWRCVAIRLPRAVRRWRRRPLPPDDQLTFPLLDETAAVA